MRLLLTIAALMLPFTTAAAAPSALERTREREAQALAKALEGRVPGKPEKCYFATRAAAPPEVVGVRTIIYRQSSRRIWVNTLREECRWLRGDRTLLFETLGSQVCSGERIDVRPSGSPVTAGYCYFGDFIPYDRVAKP
jgi:hypothetical protein